MCAGNVIGEYRLRATGAPALPAYPTTPAPHLANPPAGPQVYLAREAPSYHTGLYFAMSCWALQALCGIAMGMYLGILNKRQEKRREALGLPAKLKDISIMGLEEADAYRAELFEQLRAAGGISADELYANSFDDLTDFENPMFIYVL